MSGGTTVSGSVRSPFTSALMPVSGPVFADDIPMDRNWIEVTSKLAHYVVLGRSKKGRIIGLIVKLKAHLRSHLNVLPARDTPQ
jgi:hypothetical protein